MCFPYVNYFDCSILLSSFLSTSSLPNRWPFFLFQCSSQFAANKLYWVCNSASFPLNNPDHPCAWTFPHTCTYLCMCWIEANFCCLLDIICVACIAMHSIRIKPHNRTFDALLRYVSWILYTNILVSLLQYFSFLCARCVRFDDVEKASRSLYKPSIDQNSHSV